MRQFQLTEDETRSVGIELDEDFPARLDAATFRDHRGHATSDPDLPLWERFDGEPGSLFRRVPRRRRAA